MSVPAVLFALSSSLYLGFQWTIRIVVYPQFVRVPASEWSNFGDSHRRLVSVAVGPLFAALLLSVAALVARPPAGVATWEPAGAAVLVGALLALTGLGAVPQHRRLTAAFDRDAYRRLLAIDTARLVVAAAVTALAVALLVR